MRQLALLERLGQLERKDHRDPPVLQVMMARKDQRDRSDRPGRLEQLELPDPLVLLDQSGR